MFEKYKSVVTLSFEKVLNILKVEIELMILASAAVYEIFKCGNKITLKILFRWQPWSSLLFWTSCWLCVECSWFWRVYLRVSWNKMFENKLKLKLAFSLTFQTPGFAGQWVGHKRICYCCNTFASHNQCFGSKLEN